jgi:hypothetical protein
MRRPLITCAIIFTTTLLSACGGGGSSSNAPAQGSLTIAVTDAPVDGVTGVTVEFTGITVKPKTGSQLTFEFDEPAQIDLATLTEDNTATLLNGQTLPAGEYNWVRLDVNADCDTTFDSFVDEDTGGMVELSVPSARGLQLSSGFVITANQNTSFVIDWDLRKGLVDPQNYPQNDPQGSSCYKLKPSLRIIDLTEYGSIAGSVDPALIDATGCTSDPNTEAGNVVYVYEGADVVPDDIDAIDATEDPDTDPEPVTTANVRFNAETSTYDYMAAFLSPGSYTAAFTCQGQDDVIPDEDMPSLEDNNVIEFIGAQNVEVVDGETAMADF